MSKRKMFGKVSAIVLAIVLAFSLAVPVFASGTNPDLPDPAMDGRASITVHKFSSATESNTPGAGHEITDTSALGTKLPGVEFTLYQVNEANYTVTAASTPADVLSNAANYTEIGVEETDANGEIKWDSLELGYYVLSETGPIAGMEPVKDAFITLPSAISTDGSSWNYHVHVYPKNVKNAPISKEVQEGAERYGVGDTVKYKIDAKITGLLRNDTNPSDVKYGKFVVTDPLDTRLDFAATTSVDALGGTTQTLTTASDDSADVKVTYTTGDNTVTWELTQAGIDKVVDNGNTGLSIRFTVTINDTATGGTPAESTVILNGASRNYTDVTDAGDPKDDEDEIPDEEKPGIELGGIEIKLVDSTDNAIFLNGGEFKVATSLADAQAGTYVKAAGSTTVDAVVVTGAQPGVADSKGWAQFTGLPLNASGATTFYLVQTKAPKFDDTYYYNKRPDIIEVTIADGSKFVSVTIENTPPGADGPGPIFKLPATGGIGTLLFTVVGLALMGGAILLLVKTRRKKERN